MIYFAHSTLIMYSKTIVSKKTMSTGDFMEENKDVVRRVFNEGISVMGYELSHNQMVSACTVYQQALHYPQSVYNTEVYVPN